MIKENLKSDKDIKLFAAELKSCFSKEELEAIARETGFVKRKGKIKAWEFVCLCCFMDVEVANNTLVTLCTKFSARIGIVISNQALDQRLCEFSKYNHSICVFLLYKKNGWILIYTDNTPFKSISRINAW